MGFFDWKPEQGQTMVSPYIWLYFVVTTGFTCVTIFVWYMYNSRIKSRKTSSDLEMQSSRTGTWILATAASNYSSTVACPSSPSSPKA